MKKNIIIAILLVLLFVTSAFAYDSYLQKKYKRTAVLGKKTQEVKPTATQTPTKTPTETPAPVQSNDPSSGTATAGIPNTKQQALIEVENKMAKVKQQIQEYLKSLDGYKGTQYENSPYADIILAEIERLDQQYRQLEQSRWQIMSSM